MALEELVPLMALKVEEVELLLPLSMTQREYRCRKFRPYFVCTAGTPALSAARAAQTAAEERLLAHGSVLGAACAENETCRKDIPEMRGGRQRRCGLRSCGDFDARQRATPAQCEISNANPAASAPASADFLFQIWERRYENYALASCNTGSCKKITKP